MPLQFLLYSSHSSLSPQSFWILLFSSSPSPLLTAHQSYRLGSVPGYLQCSLPVPACHTSGIPSRRTGSSHTTRTDKWRIVPHDQLLQCLTLLEANILDVPYTLDTLLQRASTAKINCTSGSSLQTLMSVPMPFSSEKRPK